MKVTRTTQEDFDSVVAEFPEAIMIDYVRVKDAGQGQFVVEDENADGQPTIADIDDICEGISKHVRAELSIMVPGQEYDVITMVVPRPSVTLVSLEFHEE